MSKCECQGCRRSRRLSAIMEILKSRGVAGDDIDFLEDIYEQLQTFEMDMECIKTGISSEWISPDEIVSKFGISEEAMKKFLNERKSTGRDLCNERKR